MGKITDERVEAAARALCRIGTNFPTIERTNEWVDAKWRRFIEEARTALSASDALTAGEREPVAFLYDWTDEFGNTCTDASTQSITSVNFKPTRNVRPLYTSPPASEPEALRKERDELQREAEARLAEALKALDDARAAILEADPSVLTCTLWMPERISPNETVADYLDAAARRVRDGGQDNG